MEHDSSVTQVMPVPPVAPVPQRNGGANSGAPSDRPVELKVDALLAAEFGYAAQTAFQANEDRARASTFYLVTVGSLVAAILSADLPSGPGRPASWGFLVLFVTLALGGFSTAMQLAKLRQAWHESVLAMGRIKGFYLEHSGVPELPEAFRWQATTVPGRYRPWSLSFLLALQVVVLGGVALAAAILFLGTLLGDVRIVPALAGGAGFVALQLLAYWGVLRER